MTSNGTNGTEDVESKFERAVELLKELGLKEYEAKCFAVFSGTAHSTAKEISERSDVPRTRVYDAIRVLEAKGLAEVQHASPQVFRAVSIDEAVETLRQQYGSRSEELRTTLETIDTTEIEEDETTHEVWALSGTEAITSRTLKLVDEADE